MTTSSRAALLLAVAMAAAVLGTAHSATYTVGAPAGSWDLQTNYTAWASTITFRARDQLVFRYPRSTHNVLEVSKADYDSCSGSRPLAMFQTGGDTIPLPAGGVTRYFICGVQGHCNRGMKLAVKVDQGRRCRIGRRRGPVTCSSAAWSAGGVASLVGLSLAAALMSVY